MNVGQESRRVHLAVPHERTPKWKGRDTDQPCPPFVAIYSCNVARGSVLHASPLSHNAPPPAFFRKGNSPFIVIAFYKRILSVSIYVNNRPQRVLKKNEQVQSPSEILYETLRSTLQKFFLCNLKLVTNDK